MVVFAVDISRHMEKARVASIDIPALPHPLLRVAATPPSSLLTRQFAGNSEIGIRQHQGFGALRAGLGDNSARREVLGYNLERKADVFNVVAWLAEAARS
jgi:hypothetical protein